MNKKVALVTGSLLSLLVSYQASSQANSTSPAAIHFSHNFDGSTIEWPDSSFRKDEASNISYALDNDAADLYVALRVPDFPEQMKLMRMGMRFFVDLKGKKKENMGIEFPVKKDLTEGGSGTRPPETSDEGERKRPDPKAMRESMMINLIYMRIFGFDGQGDDVKDQGLTMHNTANVAFSWDDSDVMHIEYRIPLSMIDDVKSLQHKNITVGWKIFGRDITSNTGSGMATMPSGRRGGGGGRSMSTMGSRSPGSTTDRRESFEKMMKEQNFWDKYIFDIPEPTKGF